MEHGGGDRLQGHGGVLAVAALQRHGVDTVFTLSGGHLFPLYDGCVKAGIRLVDVRHEQTATFAAEAWAKVSRRPGVVALTAGPGITNGISAVTGAHFTGSPMLVLGGRAPQARWGVGSLQELDHVPILQPVTKSASTVFQTDGIYSAVDAALLEARCAHRGPVFLDIPLDVFAGTGSAPREAARESSDFETPSVAAGDLDEVASLLSQAERPVFMVGADAYWERAEGPLRVLAELVRFPVMMNGLGRGMLPADHELAFSRARSLAFQRADLVVVVGAPLDFRLGFGRFGSAKVVHLMDREDRLATHVELAGKAAGNLARLLAGLTESAVGAGLNGQEASREAWIHELRQVEQQARDKERVWLESAANPIHPGRIYGELAKRLDRNAIVVGDGGDFVSYAGKLVDSYEPGCFLDPGPFGCLGTGPGYALGAKMAHPDRQVVLVLGDGAAGFSLGDWDTLVRFRLPVVVVVGNNRCWGLEKHPMQKIFGYHVAAELSDEARYDRVMEALGGAGALVSQADELGPTLDRALSSAGPFVVNVLTDPEDTYPRSSNLG